MSLYECLEHGIWSVSLLVYSLLVVCHRQRWRKTNAKEKHPKIKKMLKSCCVVAHKTPEHFLYKTLLCQKKERGKNKNRTKKETVLLNYCNDGD